jgi:RNA polymerase sigma-B factor
MAIQTVDRSIPGVIDSPHQGHLDIPQRTEQQKPHSREWEQSDAEMFARLALLPQGDPHREAVRNHLVEKHLPLAGHLARRFRHRGEPLDDLMQVATVGLIKSVERFDPERGVEFTTFAVPTIIGEIKRHFRDRTWSIRVPRRLQELHQQLSAATAELSQRNGRSPTVAELAAHLKATEGDILETLEAGNVYSTLSLDAPVLGDADGSGFIDRLGVDDIDLDLVEDRESLKPLLERLPGRERTIVLMRFFGNMTQSQIAEELGISQMHVSRLLSRTLKQLRDQLLSDQ